MVQREPDVKTDAPPVKIRLYSLAEPWPGILRRLGIWPMPGDLFFSGAAEGKERGEEAASVSNETKLAVKGWDKGESLHDATILGMGAGGWQSDFAAMEDRGIVSSVAADDDGFGDSPEFGGIA